MANERNSEDLVEKLLFIKNHYRRDRNCIIEKQDSKNTLIADCLKNASKQGTGKGGRPEFIVSFKDSRRDYLILVETKASILKHESKTKTQPVDYAVDGVLWYGGFFKKKFNVFLIALSGEKEDDCKVSIFFQDKEGNITELKHKDEDTVGFLPMEDYIDLVEKTSDTTTSTSLVSFSKKLHKILYKEGGLSNIEKPLLVAGVLIALKNANFKNHFNSWDIKKLSKFLHDSIESEIESSDIQDEKKKKIVDIFQFIETLEKLNKITDVGTTPLQTIINEINNNIFPLLSSNSNVDIIGQFYNEFLRYAGGDQQTLGIVLTPSHITELFTDLVPMSNSSIVYDPCVGTGGFLIAGMRKLFSLAKNDKKKIEEIRRKQLVGIELRPDMFALCCANMIIRGDGKSRLYNGSSLDKEILKKIKSKDRPNIGFINPPYAQGKDDENELNFILQMLNTLKPEGYGVAIVPIKLAGKKDFNEKRKKIMESHTLLAIMNMPSEIFHPTATITCIMVFKAGVPHKEDDYTWMANWKDDGFTKTRNGRVDLNNKWSEIKKGWIDSYNKKTIEKNKSVLVKLKNEDTWAIENFLESDDDKISPTKLLEIVKKYYQFQIENFDSDRIVKYSNRLLRYSEAFEYIKNIEKSFELNVDMQRIDSLFYVSYGNKDYESKQSLIEVPSKTGVPLISSGGENNGVYGFFDIAPDSNYAISIARTGTVGSCFFQNFPVVIAGDCLILEEKYNSFAYTTSEAKLLSEELQLEIKKNNPKSSPLNILHFLVKKFNKKQLTEKLELDNIILSEKAKEILADIFKSFKSEREFFDFSEMDKVRDNCKKSENFMMQTVMYILAEQHRYSYGRTITPERIGEVQIPSSVLDWVESIIKILPIDN